MSRDKTLPFVIMFIVFMVGSIIVIAKQLNMNEFNHYVKSVTCVRDGYSITFDDVIYYDDGVFQYNIITRDKKEYRLDGGFRCIVMLDWSNNE